MFNLCDISQIKQLLKNHQFKFTKSLGQNFITNPEICPKMAEMCSQNADSAVLEIGPGIGVLTVELAKRFKKVVSVEIDKHLIPILAETTSDFDNIKVINTLTQVLDISTVKYNYSNIVEIKKDKSISNIKIPFTEKSFIVKYNGVINGGVKPEDIEIVSNTGDEIIIEIKTCQILDHYIDDENIYVYDVKNSIFNKLDIQEILEDISNCKKEYEEKIISEGFMEEIQKI